MFAIRNATRYDATAVILADPDGRDVVVVVAKATFRLDRGRLVLAEEQEPLALADEYVGEPGKSGLAWASDFALTKPRGDVVVLGAAHAPGGRAVKSLDVSVRVGPVGATLRVTGDREWTRGLLGPGIGSPQPFTTMPLAWERAYGGACPAKSGEGVEAFAANPVGAGFWLRDKDAIGKPLPNLEDPHDLVGAFKDRPAPLAFGFVAPGWSPRRELAGTYDAEWQESRMPLLPADFDAAHFNVAHPALQAPGPFAGGEPVRLAGLHPAGELAFELPRDTVEARLLLPGDRVTTHAAALDTVVVRPDAERVVLLWRATVPAPQPITSVRLVQIESALHPAAAPAGAGGARG